VISDTLVEDLPSQELVLAVIRHEMGHSKENHVIKNVAVKSVFYSVLFLSITVLVRHYQTVVLHAFGVQCTSIYLAVFIIGNFAFSVPLYLFQILENII